MDLAVSTLGRWSKNPRLAAPIAPGFGMGQGRCAVDPIVDRFLEYACPDHHVRGGWAHRIARDAALQLLKKNPEITRHHLVTAVVCGELEEVRRQLAAHPQAAQESWSCPGPDRSGPGNADLLFGDRGPKRWSPLLFLCFTRLEIRSVTENSMEIARLLLDAGADPNAFFMAGDSRYTPLVGVVGEGEESRPAHPRRDDLVRLLLERGAEPYDIQVVYNLHFRGDILWFMRLMYEHAVRRGRVADWRDPEWTMLNMGGYGTGARWHLEIGIKRNDLELVDWLLDHGANPNSAPARDPRLPRESLYREALKRGFTAIADRLAQCGAATRGVVSDSRDRFMAACLRLDRREARELIGQHPEYLQLPGPLMVAAALDRDEVVGFLLDLGMSPDLTDPEQGNQRALHVCAYSDSAKVARLLIERGAAIDPRESTFDAIPLGFAIWGGVTRMIELLSQYTGSVGNLAFLGKIDRLRTVLAECPQLAREVSQSGETSLMLLPGDDSTAAEVAQLLVACGADPAVRNRQGLTAADIARRRGLDRAASIL